jgi:hypothetical protein
MKRIISTSLVVLLVANVALAQNTSRKDVGTFGARRQLATIIFAGLSGAILGLSTLSFYGRPQDRLSNIAVGFALGIFAGTIYTTYKAAAKPSDFYGPGALLDLPPANQFQFASNNELTIKPIQLSWDF